MHNAFLNTICHQWWRKSFADHSWRLSDHAPYATVRSGHCNISPHLRSNHTLKQTSTTDWELPGAAICAGRTLCVHSSGGSTFLHKLMSRLPSWKCNTDRKSDSIDIHLHEEHSWQISSQFYLFRLFWRGRPNKNNKMSSDTRSVADLKKTITIRSSGKWLSQDLQHIQTVERMQLWMYNVATWLEPSRDQRNGIHQWGMDNDEHLAGLQCLPESTYTQTASSTDH